MKTKNIFKIVAVFLFIGAFTACVQDDDYSTPTIAEVEPSLDIINPANKVSFASVIAMYSGSMVDFSEEPLPEGAYFEAYVVSSDRTGNFYKSIYVQDAAENPTYGMRIDIDAYDTYLTYDFGRKIYVKINTLFMDDSNGVMAIGDASGTSLERITEIRAQDLIFRSTELATIVPRVTTIADIEADLINTGLLIQLDNMQLPMGDVGVTYANAGDTFTVNRYLESCDDSSTIILRNSGYADFKSQDMPIGRGAAVAVLSQYSSDKQLFISDPSDLNFTDSRCDPLFGEAFSDAADGTTLDTTGWINYAEAGSELWTEQEYSGNGYAEFSAFGTGDVSNIGWLISPGIDMDAESGEILSFKTEHAYPDAGHTAIEAFISTDFDGTEAGIATATWISLDFTSSLEADFGTWYSWVDSGDIDLSSYTGTAHIAFKYTGSDTTNMNTTVHVDDVVVRVP